MITLIEGSSVSPNVVAKVKQQVQAEEKVLVVLDLNHSYDHVSAELAAYAPLVAPGSYIIATDGLMRDLANVPRGEPAWKLDNPSRAAEDFVTKHRDFALEEPAWTFNELTLAGNVTHWPNAWIQTGAMMRRLIEQGCQARSDTGLQDQRSFKLALRRNHGNSR